MTDAVSEDELCIKMIPLIEIDNLGVKPLWNSCSTWSVYADLKLKQIKFAKYGSFQIQDRDLRGRGLGSYVLSDLVQWVKQYHPNFSIERLFVKGFDDKQPGDWEQRESLYKGVGFQLKISDDGGKRSGVAIAENSSVLHENRNPNKVETINLMKFIEILEENCRLRGNKNDLERRLKNYQQGYDKLESKLVFWRASTIFLIASIVALGFVFHR